MKTKSVFLLALLGAPLAPIHLQAAPQKAPLKKPATQQPRFEYCLVNYTLGELTVYNSNGSQSSASNSSRAKAAAKLSELGRSGWRVIACNGETFDHLTWTLERRR